MFSAVRGFTIVSIVAVGTLGVLTGSASALPIPIQQHGVGAELTAKVSEFYQVIKHRYKRHRSYRHGHGRRITLGINKHRCHSPEWNHVYRYHGLAHQPRHHHTPEGVHYYDDPFWDFEPWWCDDKQVVGHRFEYKHYRHHRKKGYRPKTHVRWCQEQYASYDPRFNTYIGHSGKHYQCDSPYDFR
jgi:hypothetical protein